jgi:O-succinylbenzoate synthase
MTAWFHRYTLVPRARPNAVSSAAPREGALIRIGDGYADVHPWPELGDPPLAAHLASIAAGRPTRLAKQSLECAARDGEARDLGVSLFEGLAIPPSHYAVGLGEIPEFAFLERAGFDRVKLKAGPEAAAEVERLRGAAASLARTKIRLRIDFNASLAFSDLREVLENVPPSLIERIDFLEDPVPPDPPAWKEIRSRWGLRIAADRDKPDPDCWDVAVIKPASEPKEVIEKMLARARPIVFTSSMDHPIGQMWAAWIAATTYQDHPGSVGACGLLSHSAFEENAFSERLETDGPRLLVPEGTGLGFDDLLEALDWTRLT